MSFEFFSPRKEFEDGFMLKETIFAPFLNFGFGIRELELIGGSVGSFRDVFGDPIRARSLP